MYLISGLNWSGIIRDPQKNNQESSKRMPKKGVPEDHIISSSLSQAQITSVGQKSALEMKQQWQSKKAEEEEKAFLVS